MSDTGGEMAENATRQSIGEKLGAELRIRAISGLALAALGLAALVMGGAVCALWIAVICAAMAWEWMQITWRDASPALQRGFAAMSGLSVLVAYIASPMIGLAAALALPVLCLFFGRKRTAGARWTLIGIVMLTAAGVEFVWLRSVGLPGFLTALWLVLVVVATDVGGFFAGRLIGGRKLAPRISPNKTWAGALGGVALAALVGAAFSAATAQGVSRPAIVFSVVLSVASIAGDLFESAAKRRFGVKDAGTLLPGHGGFCDRFDGLMSATLALAVLAMLQDGDNVLW